jgi:hypothetical protein
MPGRTWQSLAASGDLNEFGVLQKAIQDSDGSGNISDEFGPSNLVIGCPLFSFYADQRQNRLTNVEFQRRPCINDSNKFAILRSRCQCLTP